MKLFMAELLMELLFQDSKLKHQNEKELLNQITSLKKQINDYEAQLKVCINEH